MHPTFRFTFFSIMPEEMLDDFDWQFHCRNLWVISARHTALSQLDRQLNGELKE